MFSSHPFRHTLLHFPPYFMLWEAFVTLQLSCRFSQWTAPQKSKGQKARGIYSPTFLQVGSGFIPLINVKHLPGHFVLELQFSPDFRRNCLLLRLQAYRLTVLPYHCRPGVLHRTIPGEFPLTQPCINSPVTECYSIRALQERASIAHLRSSLFSKISINAINCPLSTAFAVSHKSDMNSFIQFNVFFPLRHSFSTTDYLKVWWFSLKLLGDFSVISLILVFCSISGQIHSTWFQCFYFILFFQCF